MLEVLCQPLGDKIATIRRAAVALTFPANFTLVAAQNPYYGDSERVARYSKRISGPLLDRIDMHVEVPRVNYDKLMSEQLGEPSAPIWERVAGARERQRTKNGWCSAADECRHGAAEIRRWCALDSAGQSLMRQMQLSARTYHRAGALRAKLARTIADLAQARAVGW